jgi:4-hydroxy-tetrahydrodipicolinate synthase
MRVTQLFDAILAGGDFPEGFRFAVELRGFNFGPGRQPVGDRQVEKTATLKVRLESLIESFNLSTPLAAHSGS